jgi:hypothetical protein
MYVLLVYPPSFRSPHTLLSSTFSPSTPAISLHCFRTSSSLDFSSRSVRFHNRKTSLPGSSPVGEVKTLLQTTHTSQKTRI